MEPIPLFRAAHLISYINFLRTIGMPVERRLTQAGLPTMFEVQADAYLPLLPVLNFLSAASREEGIVDLGLHASRHLELTDLSHSFVMAARQAPTLHIVLEAFCKLAPLEESNTSFWINYETSKVRICSLTRVACEAEGIRCSEWVQNMALVAIIRAFAGSTWYPNEMAFRSSVPLGRYAIKEFPHTHFLVGQTAAWIDVPRSLLSLPQYNKQDTHVTQAFYESVLPNPVEPALDFPSSLKRILATYLRDGYPDIRLAAEIADTSVRTLQRELGKTSLSYSRLIQQARFEAATQMLKDPDIKVIDAAYDLGYENPSNFARAFRRMGGVSPREYRRLHCPH